MKHDVMAFEAYKSSFPSDAFLQKLLGSDASLEGNTNRSEVKGLRYLFDGVLRCLPRHLLRAQDPKFEPVYLFIEGRPESWVDEALERRGLLVELSENAFLELCQQFIIHCKAGALRQDDWWHWQVVGHTVWVEVVPEAIAADVHKSRSLSDLLKRT